MQKLLIILLAVCSVSEASFSQSACFSIYNSATDEYLLDKNKDEFNLNGKIKSILLTSFDVVDKFGEISKGKKNCEQEILFNQNGDISQRKILLPPRKNVRYAFIVKYQYDFNRFLKSVKAYTSDGSPLRQTIFTEISNWEYEGKSYAESALREAYPETFDEYVKQGILTKPKKKIFKEMVYNSKGSTNSQVKTRYYNRDGKITQLTWELLNIDETHKTNYFYDNLGRLTKRSCPSLSTTTYFYQNDDSKYWNYAVEGQGKYGKNQIRREYTYHNDLKKEVYSSSNWFIEYSYDYDAMGNWIRRRTIWQPKGEIKSITERTITYY